MRCPSLYRLTLAAVALLLFSSLAFAQKGNGWMGRFSAVEGEVSYRRADDAEQYWFDAAVNTPLGENDQVFTSRAGRAEIQLTGRNIVRLDYDTSFKITQFTTDLTQISLQLGTATFRIDSLDRRQFQLVDVRDLNNRDSLYFEVNTPTVAVTLLKEGVYRLSVREDGTTEVSVQRGEAEIYNRELGNLTVREGRRVVVEGDDPSNYQIARTREKDAWDRWSEQRDEELALRYEQSLSARYVPTGVPGVYDLDRYGDWYNTPDYGYVWSPRLVTTGWAPYRAGYWQWYPGYGWTWISTEPWGWAPYHYGRWAYYRNRWCWVPRDSFTMGFSWAPALVTFFGFDGSYRSGYRDGFSDGYRRGYRDGIHDWVGWVPLAPGERDYRHSTVVVNNTTVNNSYGPTQINSYRNYNAPGGVTGLAGRYFVGNRVVVRNQAANNITPPPGGDKAYRSAFALRGDAMRPVVSASQATTTPQSINPIVARAAANRVITRGAVISDGNTSQPSGALRSRENGVPTLRDTGTPHRSDEQRQPAGRDIFRRPPPAANNAGTPDSTSGADDATGRRPRNPYQRGERSDLRSSDQPSANPPNQTAPRFERPPQRSIERPTERPLDRPAGRNHVEPGRIERPIGPRVFGRDSEPSRQPPREAPREAQPPSQPSRVEPVERPQRREPFHRRIEPSESPREVQRPEPRHEPRPERPAAPPPREYSRPERPAAPPPREYSRPERYERPTPPAERPAPRPEARPEPPRHVERPSAPRENSRPERSGPRESVGRRIF